MPILVAVEAIMSTTKFGILVLAACNESIKNGSKALASGSYKTIKKRRNKGK
jgi:hypothetical protein